MTAILPMSMITLGLGFLVSVMGGFSAIAGAGSPDQPAAIEDVGSSAEEMSTKFLGGYTAIMDGLMDAQAHSGSLFSTLESWERDVLKLMARSFPDDTVTEED